MAKLDLSTDRTLFHANKAGRFTARRYASVVYAMALCLSVCLSVTSRCSTKTAGGRITLTVVHNSPESLVFWWQRSPRNSTLQGRQMQVGWVTIGDSRKITGYISTRRSTIAEGPRDAPCQLKQC